MLLPLKPCFFLYSVAWETVVHNLKRSANLINHWERILECNISSPKSPSCKQATDFLSWYPYLSNCCFVPVLRGMTLTKGRHFIQAKDAARDNAHCLSCPKSWASPFTERNPHPSQTAERRRGPEQWGERVKKPFVPKGGTKRKTFRSSSGTV